MTTLVVGGAGYIGSHTVKKLQELKEDCLVIDNLIYGHQQSIASTRFEKVDITNKESLDNIFKNNKISSVIHFAAYAYVGESIHNPLKYYDNNVTGTINLLQTMINHQVKKIVFSSTCATYGESLYTPIDEKHPQKPVNPYGHSKLMMEQILNDCKNGYGLRYIALRYFNASGASIDSTIGESHSPETHLIPLILQAIKNNQPISVFGNDYETPDGTCLRDYIHVEDLADAHILALAKLDQFSGCINLGTGKKISVMEVIKAAEKVTGKKCLVNITNRRSGDPAILCANNDMAKEILTWQPKYTDINQIVETAWKWESNRRY